MTRIAVNENERTLVERARTIEKLRERQTKLEAELLAVRNDLTAARQALVDEVTAGIGGIEIKEVPVGELATA